MPKPQITAKRIAFAREYCIDLNATQAAIRAGYSPHTAGRIAWKLLRDPAVVQLIHDQMAKISTKADVTAERVLTELARVGFASQVASVRGGHVWVPDTDALHPDQRAAIAELSETETGIKVKMHDKVRALEALGRHLGLFLDRTEHSGSLGLHTELSDEDLERIAARGRDGVAAAPAGPQEPT